ncbi:MAG: thermonuclease family protein [Phycisphaerales bacterium]|nr:MAG: thermonuclease family protein [Phycisphaerales bacterium]
MQRLAGVFQDHRAAILRSAGVVILLSISIVFLWRGLRAPGEPPPSDRPLKAEVIRAISGHKLKLETDEYVVYAGIRSLYEYEDKDLSEKALHRNTELVEGKEVRLRFDQAGRNREGHLLAYVFVEGELVNETLVREGLAYVRLTATTQRFAERLLAAQVEARHRKRGLWKEKITATERSYVGDPKYGNFHRPGCEELTRKPPERLKTLKSKSRAFQAGFAPCVKCRP